MSNTTHLQLPLLAAAQAQKHVTHNDALLRLDAIVQLSVKDCDLAAPPGSPSDGDRYIVASGGSGAWDGWDGDVAAYTDGAWVRFTPRAGWTAYVEDEEKLLIHDGTEWGLLDDEYVLKSGDTMTGALQVPDGTEEVPSLAVGAADTGFNGIGGINVSHNGRHVFHAGEWGTWAFPDPALEWGGLAIDGEAHIELYAHRADDDPGSALVGAYKSRGSLAAPASINQDDELLRLFGAGRASGSWPLFGEIQLIATAASPSSNNRAARWTILAGPASGAPTELARLEHATGLSMFGANPLIDEDRHFNLRSYTVATLPSADPAGMLAFVTDAALSGAQKVIYSDGSDWRYVQNGNVVS